MALLALHGVSKSYGALKGTDGITLAVAEGGAYLFTGDTAGHLRRWALPSLAPAGQLRGHSGAIKHIAVHPSQPYVATASLDRTCLVFHADTRQLLRRLRSLTLVGVFADDGFDAAHRGDVHRQRIGAHLLEPRIAMQPGQVPQLLCGANTVGGVGPFFKVVADHGRRVLTDP